MNWRSTITTFLAAFVVYPNCCCLAGAHSEGKMDDCDDSMAMPECCQPIDKPTPEDEGEKSCPHRQGKPLLKQTTVTRDILKPSGQHLPVTAYVPVLWNNFQLGSPSYAILKSTLSLRSPPLPSLRKLHCSYLL